MNFVLGSEDREHLMPLWFGLELLPRCRNGTAGTGLSPSGPFTILIYCPAYLAQQSLAVLTCMVAELASGPSEIVALDD